MTPTTAAEQLSQPATVKVGDKSIDLPVLRGSEGETAIDIATLRAKTGAITLDPGYGNTGSCKSAITFIDGEKGILRYRGYPIEELAEKSTFLEVAWLLLHGELPTPSELETFRHEITHHTMLHENFRRFFEALPKDAHPMPVCAAAVGALATFYQEPETDARDARDDGAPARQDADASPPTPTSTRSASRSCTRTTTSTTPRTSST